MTDFPKVRIGVWGCGGHAVNHLKHLPPNVEVVAFCDHSREAMARANETLLHPAIPLTSSQDFLALSSLEAIFISTPDQFHAPQIREALNHNLHVLAEKPLAVDGAQFPYLKQSVEFARTKGLKFLTCHPRRFDPRNQWIKFAMPHFKAYLGEPKEMSFIFEYPAPSDWKNSRGLLMDHVNHEIDLMGNLLGVANFSATRRCDSPTEYHVVGSRVDGARFSFSGTRNARIKNWGESREVLTIVFQRGKIAVQSSDTIVRISENGKLMEIKIPVPSRGHHFERYRDVMQNFADVVRGMAEPYVSHEEMLVNTAAGVYLTTRGVYNSSVDGKPICD